MRFIQDCNLPSLNRSGAGAMLMPLLCAIAIHAHAAERSPNTVSAMRPVEIDFAAQVNGKPAACAETYQGVGTSKAALFLQDFRVYVSSVRLIAKGGKEVPVALTPDQIWQSEQVALLDFENGSGNCNGNAPTNTRIIGTVPAGDYRGIVFDIGVPFEQNHQDPTLAGAPLNYSALTWPWRIGYKFTTIDFDTKPASERKMLPVEGMHQTVSATGFSVHLGSMECASSGPRVPPKAACGSPNRPTYRFDSFDPGKQLLVMDLGTLLAGTDVTHNMLESPSGCMAGAKDDDCVDIMNRFGLAFRGKASSGQKFIRVEQK